MTSRSRQEGGDGRLPVSPEVWRAILDGYALPLLGIHGLGHWARVMENGLRIAGAAGADPQVVAHFAVFHDARRHNEDWDPGHGARGAALARELRPLLALDDDQVDLLCAACELHTDALTHPDPTVRACFDADRLDLFRVGIRPDPLRLCTDAARDPEVLAWGTRRGWEAQDPSYVREVWLG